jgi:hypothetical protein
MTNTSYKHEPNSTVVNETGQNKWQPKVQQLTQHLSAAFETQVWNTGKADSSNANE